MVKLNSKKIRKFLSTLNDAEYSYIKIQMHIAQNAKDLVKDFKLNRSHFCLLLDIKDEQYESFLSGGFNYDLEKMALLESAYIKLSKERDEEKYKKEIEKNFVTVAK